MRRARSMTPELWARRRARSGTSTGTPSAAAAGAGAYNAAHQQHAVSMVAHGPAPVPAVDMDVPDGPLVPVFGTVQLTVLLRPRPRSEAQVATVGKTWKHGDPEPIEDVKKASTSPGTQPVQLVFGKTSSNRNCGTELAESVRPEDEAQVCGICLEEFGAGEELTALPCSVDGCQSVWHSRCIRKWLCQGPALTCPLCRTKFDVGNGPSGEEPPPAVSFAVEFHTVATPGLPGRGNGIADAGPGGLSASRPPRSPVPPDLLHDLVILALLPSGSLDAAFASGDPADPAGPQGMPPQGATAPTPPRAIRNTPMSVRGGRGQAQQQVLSTVPVTGQSGGNHFRPSWHIATPGGAGSPTQPRSAVQRVRARHPQLQADDSGPYADGLAHQPAVAGGATTQAPGVVHNPISGIGAAVGRPAVPSSSGTSWLTGRSRTNPVASSSVASSSANTTWASGTRTSASRNSRPGFSNDSRSGAQNGNQAGASGSSSSGNNDVQASSWRSLFPQMPRVAFSRRPGF